MLVLFLVYAINGSVWVFAALIVIKDTSQL